MTKVEIKELLDSGVHFGHLTRKWNPNMAPYIYTERNGVHIIDLYKTTAKIEEAATALQKIASSGRKILFVATKKQAKDIVSEKAESVNMPFITERWPGGMLTNFVTIRKAVKKMATIDRMKQDGSFKALSKRERLQINRQREKLEKNLGSISEMTRLPGALFVVDIKKEHIAVSEAQKLNIPIFAMVDTNSDPRDVDFVIPSNDDASKSINKVLGYVVEAISEGLSDRKTDKETKEKEDVKTAPKAKKEEAVVEDAKAEVVTEEKTEVKAAPKAKKVEAVVEDAKAEVVTEEKTEVKTAPKTKKKETAVKETKVKAVPKAKKEEVVVEEAKSEKKTAPKTKKKETAVKETKAKAKAAPKTKKKEVTAKKTAAKKTSKKEE